MVWRVILLGVLMLGGLVASPPMARAQIACGASITTNTGLTGDLDCSSMPTSNAPALSIGADNVTFALNGHTLTCNGVLAWPREVPEADRPGIDTQGHSHVTILGPGKITGCGRAVVASGNGVIAQGLTLTKNHTGVLVWNGNPLFRDNVIVSNYGNGVELNSPNGTTLQRNHIAGNRSWGVTNISPGTTTFDGNFILGNGHGGIGEFGPSVNWVATLVNNVILGNGTWTDEFDLYLRDGDDLLTGTNCGTSNPPGLCPSLLPRFPTASPTAVGVFRPSEGNWYIRNSQTGTVTVQQWGTTGDVPVAGDFDGDGKPDIAVWRPSEGNWYIRNSQTGTVTVQQWGAPTDIPVPGDYDGDGTTDIAVWRPAEGNWYIISSATGAVTVQQWGTTGDLPVVGKW
jgi:hypothetical protein